VTPLAWSKLQAAGQPPDREGAIDGRGRWLSISNFSPYPQLHVAFCQALTGTMSDGATLSHCAGLIFFSNHRECRARQTGACLYYLLVAVDLITPALRHSSAHLIGHVGEHVSAWQRRNHLGGVGVWKDQPGIYTESTRRNYLCRTKEEGANGICTCETRGTCLPISHQQDWVVWGMRSDDFTSPTPTPLIHLLVFLFLASPSMYPPARR